jgi:hypothetical protein
MSGAFETVTSGVKNGVSYLTGTGDGSSLLGDVKSVIGDIETWIKVDAKKKMKKAFEKVTSAIKEAFEIEVDWPEPPTIVKKAYNGTLGSDFDWPSRDGGGGGGGGGGGPLGGGPILGGGPLLDTGGFVESTGRAVIHEGEEIVPEAEVDRDRGGSGSRPVTADITVYAQDGTDAGQQIADEMDRFL